MNKLVLNSLKNILRENQIFIGKDHLLRFNSDWTNIYKGNSEILVKPQETSEVSKILKVCNEFNQPVQICGGLTSLVGGATPEKDELIISLDKMNKFEFDPDNGILTSEAGVILENIQNHIRAFAYDTPYNLGAKGSCTIGGNIATNAGGINYIKYGSLRNYILRLEIVLANGEILNLGSLVRKDNTGPDLKHLFIGNFKRK